MAVKGEKSKHVLKNIKREGNGNPLQYSCLENLMGGGAWWATVYGVAKSWTRLSDFISFFISSQFLKGDMFMSEGMN